MLAGQEIPERLMSCFSYQEPSEDPQNPFYVLMADLSTQFPEEKQKIFWIPEITAVVKEFETVSYYECREWILKMQNKKCLWLEEIENYKVEYYEARKNWQKEFYTRLETESGLLKKSGLSMITLPKFYG